MSGADARKATRQNKISGYYHHSYEQEKMMLRAFLNGDREALRIWKGVLPAYADILAPLPLRAMKNAAICTIAVICRAVIEAGADVEQSFSISDYYINELEKQTDEESLQKVFGEMLDLYMDLAQNSIPAAYSLPVLRSIRYIRNHLYEPCRVSQVAGAVGVHRSYLSSLFKSEVGLEISRYIQGKKMNEAKELLMQNRYSVGEIADMLGFCDVASFSNAFKRQFGVSPKNYAGRHLPVFDSH